MTAREFVYNAIRCCKRRKRRQKYTLCRHTMTGLSLKQDGWIDDSQVEELKQALIDKVLTIYDVVENDMGEQELRIRGL